ncbi:hypothetical protein [Neobacillus drentensis]|uniref:hypothetical protein n=1 Tax=Neobacillus drentensis TaxID=220684 RepID=UPI002FFDD595
MCYTLDNHTITEKMKTEVNVEKEEVEQKVVEKINNNQFFNVKNDQGDIKINSSLVRFVRIIDEKL